MIPGLGTRRGESAGMTDLLILALTACLYAATAGLVTLFDRM
ncbi:MAG: hypothetical protein U0326_21670 [Polyangiales bacterium]